jgi:hypothetical protein
MPREAVSRAERLWETRLRDGITMPNGEIARVEASDLYHLIVDDRIWRHPERIERALRHVFEIRAARSDRRQAFSRWREPDGERLASVILMADNRVWSLHLIDERRLRRYTRGGGAVLWSG